MSSFCGKCGAETAEGKNICASCEQSVNAPVGSPFVQPQIVQTVQQQNFEQDYEVDEEQDAQSNKVMAILAYIIFFIPLITGDHKNSPFVRFHTNQGIVLFITTILLSIALGILSGIFSILPWTLYRLITMLFNFIRIAPFVYVVIGIINVAGGNKKELPVIGQFKILS